MSAATTPFRAVLATQWKWSRLVVLVLGVIAFAVPLVSVRRVGDPALGFPSARELLVSMQLFGAWYPVLATTIGLLLATIPWSADHAGRHVYALALPVPRWRYVLLRFGAGALLALVPAAMLAVGALLASLGLTLPLGLHAQPIAIALRFALATLIAFAAFFGIASSSVRSAGIMLAGLLLVVLIDLTFAASNVTERSLIGQVAETLVRWPGVFEIFTGRWMLIDV